MMLPDLQSSLLCDDVRQEMNGKFILIGLFDGLAVRDFPARFPRICLVNRWCCGEGKFTQRSRILAPDGSVIIEGKDVPVNVASDTQTATSIEFFINAVFPAPGVHWVEILLDGNLKIRYPLSIRKAVQRPPEGTAKG